MTLPEKPSQDIRDAMPPDPAQIVQQLIVLLDDFTQDWDHEFEGSMNRDTKLFADLGFESIDIIQLAVAIEEDVTHRKMAFDKLLMKDGRYIDDLSIGQIADFIAAQAGARA